MSTLTQTQFNYDLLDHETGVFVADKTVAIKRRLARTSENILEVGRMLTEVKERLEYGQFGAWLEAEFQMSDRMAQRFMRVYETFKSDNLSELSLAPSALYALAAPSTPPEAREEVMAWARNGQAVSHKQAKEIIDSHRQDEGDREPVPFPDPVPEARDVQADRDFFQTVKKTHSADRIGNGEIKRPFEYDGKLYVCMGGGWNKTDGKYEYADRVVPIADWPGRPYTMEEVRERKAYGPCYYFGIKVVQGSKEFILDPRDRIRFLLVDEVPEEEPTDYTPVWQLESGVRSYLDSYEAFFGRTVTVEDRIEILERMGKIGYGALFSSGLLTGPYRKRDVVQAVNNVLEQLRQKERWSDDVLEAPAVNVLHSSESNEYYTPAPYVEAVREVMGAIDLDPASCALANETVQAERFYTVEEDGLEQAWRGRVFLNPPYGKEGGESNQGRWSHRLIEEYKAGNVEEAILLVNATPGNRWWAPLWYYLICFPDHRIHFDTPEGETRQATHSNAFVYLGKNSERFVEVFTQFGPVVLEVVSENA